jgi:signal transduction histidine kinase
LNAAQLRVLLDHAEEPIIVVDADLRVTYTNARGASSLGEVRGRLLPDLLPGVYGAGAPNPAGPWRVVKLDVGWAVFGRSGGGESDQRFQQLLQAEQLAAVGQLSAAVVHEIGAPLTAIEIAADRLAKREGESARSQDEDRELILAQTHRIAQLSRLLTNLAGPGTPQVRAVNVNEVVREVVDAMGRALEEAHIQPTLDLDEGMGRIASDPRRIQQVVVTLLSNARDAMPEGGRLDVFTRRREGWVELRVVDSGTGIGEEDLSRIFLPFFSRTGGTGLGLPLARQLVHSLGGTISVLTEEGRGATFIVLLPGKEMNRSPVDQTDG